MKMVEAHFKERKGVLTIKFNGWLFEGYEDAKTVLMGTILDELIKNRTLTDKGKKLVSKLVKKVNWMKLATAGTKAGLGFLTLGPIGLSLGALDTAEIVKKLSEADYEGYIDEKAEDLKGKSLRMEIREFHKDFSELLNETKIERLIVFIDDLDRCNPNTVIDTLEAIKLFLFVENSAFVIGADERLIKYAVKKRFPEIPGEGRFEVGRDYLEKLIQFPIRIPQLSQSEMETYINLLFTSLSVNNLEVFERIRARALEKKSTTLFSTSFNISNLTEIIGGDIGNLNHAIIDEIKESLSLSARITPILSKGLQGNPRQSKRFLNTMLLRMIMSESKGVNLDRGGLAKLMILEYFKPELFKKLSGLQVKQDGKSEQIEIIENHLKDKSGSKKEKDDEPKKATLDSNLELWLSDEEIKEWFSNEPWLSGVDLRPYFYFSRDSLGTVPVVIQRMSQEAQEAYVLLISDSRVERNSGSEKLSGISSGDSAAIFEVITEKFHQKDTTADDESYLNILILVAEKRNELIPQLFMFLETLPYNKIPNTSLLKLIQAVESTPHKPTLVSTIKKWSENSQNNALAKLAKSRLTTLESV